jgi:hypothetical protein
MDCLLLAACAYMDQCVIQSLCAQMADAPSKAPARAEAEGDKASEFTLEDLEKALPKLAQSST